MVEEIVNGTKIDFTKDFARVRIKDPKRFQKKSFRTLDVGRPGGTKVVIGRLKGKVTTTTQSILIPREEFTPTKLRATLRQQKVKRG